ncbi:MAG: site-2 protease family protein [Myxococcota bacterium]|nr:site-2 protease family protein [Myxococcota bacterium]
MEWKGLKIGTVRGIPIRIHFTFLLVLPLLAFSFSRSFKVAAEAAGIPVDQLTGNPMLWGLGIALALFASVLLHELAHSLYALSKGGRVEGITLLMIGGVSQLSQPPKEARDEGVMALVGPLLSLGLGGGLFLLGGVLPGGVPNLKLLLIYLGMLNLVLGLFNLLPAFPMDGGRILRALLTRRLGRVGATVLAARVGKGFALLFGLWGLLSGNLMLLLIAVFVFIGAEGESQSVTTQEAFARLQVEELMNPQVATVPSQLPLEEAADRMLATRTLTVAVTDASGVRGVLTLELLRAVPVDQRATLTAAEVAAKVPVVGPQTQAIEVARLLSQVKVPLVLVEEAGALVGVVTREDLSRGLKLQELRAVTRPVSNGDRLHYRRSASEP